MQDKESLLLFSFANHPQRVLVLDQTKIIKKPNFVKFIIKTLTNMRLNQNLGMKSTSSGNKSGDI